jgi:predicted Na+-dependent transporter
MLIFVSNLCYFCTIYSNFIKTGNEFISTDLKTMSVLAYFTITTSCKSVFLMKMLGFVDKTNIVLLRGGVINLLCESPRGNYEMIIDFRAVMPNEI